MFKNYIKKVIKQELLRSYNRFDNEIGIIREAITEAITEATEERGKDYVVCQDCKCVLNKPDAHKVTNYNRSRTGYCPDRYYCQRCRPDYDEVHNNGYMKRVCVDENGKPIGYKKIKSRK